MLLPVIVVLVVLDWSIIDAQVASSMRDVDEDSDDEVTAEDENELLVSIFDIKTFFCSTFCSKTFCPMNDDYGDDWTSLLPSVPVCYEMQVKI